MRLYKEGKRERFLKEDEYRRLGRVLDEAQAEGSLGPHGIAAIRLLLLTGCRRDEIVTLRWDDVDRAAGELRLRETKTGARMIPLTPAVEEVLAGIPRVPGNPWVIAGAKAGSHMANVDKVWRRLRERAGLEDVRIHDLRHSYASRALALGESLTMIGRLLGHTKVGTTARYAHLARDTERASVARVGGSIGSDIHAGRRCRSVGRNFLESWAGRDSGKRSSGMAKLRDATISRRTVEALEVGKDTVFWDRELTGFGVRVYPSGSKYYVVQTRGPEGPRRITVGRHGVITADQARRRAALMIARIKAGEEPIPEPMVASRKTGPTVAEVAERYLDEHVAVRCKPRTAEAYSSVIRRHIVPMFGDMTLAAVGRKHVTDLHYALRDVPSTANRSVDVLSRLFAMGEAWGLVPEGANPCRYVVKYRERPRERFLTEEELRRLGRVLREAKDEGGASMYAVAAIRLLLLTGCRRNEILTLRWADVDLDGAS